MQFSPRLICGRDSHRESLFLLQDQKDTFASLRRYVSTSTPPNDLARFNAAQELPALSVITGSGLDGELTEQLRLINGMERRQGMNTPSTSSLRSVSDEAYNDSGPSTPQSSTFDRKISQSDRTSTTSMGHSRAESVSSCKQFNGRSETQKEEVSADFTVNEDFFKDFPFDIWNTSLCSHSESDDFGFATISAPQPPPKSVIRPSLSPRKSYSTLLRMPSYSPVQVSPNTSRSAPSMLRSVNSMSSTFTLDRIQAPSYTFIPEPEPERKPKRKLFQRRSLAWKPSVKSQQVLSAAKDDGFSIQWLNPTACTTFQSMSCTSVHPAFAKTTMTIPFLGATSSLSRSAPARWISSKTDLEPAKTKSGECRIDGVVSDGQSTRTVEAIFFNVNDLKELVMLKQEWHSDVALAVLCFSIIDASTLDKATRKVCSPPHPLRTFNQP